MKKEKVIIFDTTLRDGEQAAPASLSVDQKLRIARQLARLGVDVIEAGFPISSPGDFESVSTIAREMSKEGPAICGLARLVEKDIVTCAKAVKPAAQSRVHVFVGTSAIHTEKKLRKSEEEILAMITGSIKLARRLCGDVEFSAEDAGRTHIDFLCKVTEAAIRAGARTINIPDTVGYTPPEHFGAIIDGLFNRVPNIDKAIISVHCHNDLGMSTANSLTAISHGARQVECTINGIGERAGNTALEEVVMALKVRADFFKAYTDIDTREIMRTSKLVREICNMPVQPNKAVVGANAFAHSSGIHQDGVLKAKKTYEIMSPQSVGLKDNKMNLTSRSGSHMVKSRLAELGYADSDYDMSAVYAKFKTLADKKGTVYDDDLVTLMEAQSGEDLADAYALDYLNVSSGKGVVPTATVRITSGGKTVQAAACGNGPVDAATRAIDEIVGYKMKVDNLHIDAITEGRQAQAKVTIQASAAVGSFVGSGVSTDIVEASVLAYMDIVNKIARMKKFNRKIPKK